MILHYAHNFHFFFTSYNQFSLANVLLESAGLYSPQTLLAIKDQFVFFCCRNQDGSNERHGRRSLISEIYFRYAVQVMSSILLRSITK